MRIFRSIRQTTKGAYHVVDLTNYGRINRKVNISYLCEYIAENNQSRVNCYFLEFFPEYDPPYVEEGDILKLNVEPTKILTTLGNLAECIDHFSFILKEKHVKSENSDKIENFEIALIRSIENFIPRLVKDNKIYVKIDVNFYSNTCGIEK